MRPWSRVPLNEPADRAYQAVADEGTDQGGPLVVPHPEHDPADIQDVDQHCQQDERDRQRHSGERDYNSD